MDVNGTPLHLFAGAGDWERVLSASPSELAWDERLGSVRLANRALRFVPGAAAGSPASTHATLALEERRGAAADEHGHVYWIGPDRASVHVTYATGGSGVFVSSDLFRTECARAPEPALFGPTTPSLPAMPRFRGLAATPHGYLLVGSSEPPGLLVFDLHGGGPPEWRAWPDEGFDPFDIAANADGSAWILDRRTDRAPARLWRVDRGFRTEEIGGGVVAALPDSPGPFRCEDASADPCAGAEPPRFALGLPLDSLPGVEDPIALSALPDGSGLLLDRGTVPEMPHRIHVVDRNGELISAPLPAIDAGEDLGVLEWGRDLVAHELSFRAGEGPGSNDVLFVVGDDGNQVFAYLLELLDLPTGARELKLSLLDRYLPLRRFGGKALVRCGPDVLYDSGDRWVPLVEQPRRRYLSEGSVRLAVLDGGLPGCVWHRVTYDGCLPGGCRVDLRSRAADSEAELARADWGAPEPAFVLRSSGSEIPYHDPFRAPAGGRGGVGTYELLLQSASGRWLELELRLVGTGSATPHVRALRVHYRRFSQAERYLPAVYREDSETASFTDRFLANLEGLYTTLEGRIANAQILLDSRSAPPEYLEWLASWMGAVLEQDWDEQRRRLFIEHAHLLYEWRGTAVGMRATIRLAIDPCVDATLFDELRMGRATQDPVQAARGVRIVENFALRTYGAQALGDASEPGMLPQFQSGTSWRPEHGAESLHAQFGAFLQASYADSADALEATWGTSPGPLRFAPLPPGNEAQLADWRAFVAAGLDFEYAELTESDLVPFRGFLRRRYRRIEALNEAHWYTGGSALFSFEDIAFPTELPEGGAALLDWIEYVSSAVPLRREAHRFTVLVPTVPGESQDVRDARVARVDEIVRRARPAHTNHEVKAFWDLFQVGTARLGFETLLGDGSRYVFATLGTTYLGQVVLGSSHPWNLEDRWVVGRDAPEESRT